MVPAVTSLPTGITAGQTGHVGHTNTVHGATNALTAIASPTFNVKDVNYGAKGDGVTNDQPAIQAAVNAANTAYAASGAAQEVVIPAGLYMVGAVAYFQDDGTAAGITSIKLLDGVNVTGKGTLKVPNTTYGSGAYYRIFSSHDGTGSGVRLSNASISGITVDGNKANQVASGQCSNIELWCKANVTVDGVTSLNANGNGIMLRGTATANGTNLVIRRCTVLTANTIGIQASQFDGLIISNNYIDATADNNIDIYGDDGTTTTHAKGFLISNNVCKNSGLVGIFPETVREGVISGNMISGCAAAGIHINRINGAPQAITVSGNTIATCPSSVIVSGDTNGIVFTANTFRDFATTGVQLGTTGGNVSRVAILNNVFDPPNNTTYLIQVTCTQVAFMKSYGNIVIAGNASYYLNNTATATVGCTFTAPVNIEA